MIEWRSRVKVMRRSLNHHLACQPWCCLHPSDVRVSLSSRQRQRVNILNRKRRLLSRRPSGVRGETKKFSTFYITNDVQPPLIPSQLLFAFNDREACKNFLVNIKIIDDASLRLWIYTATSPIFHRRRLAGGREWKMGRDFILHAAELIVDSSELTKYMSASSNEKPPSKQPHQQTTLIKIFTRSQLWRLRDLLKFL